MIQKSLLLNIEDLDNVKILEELHSDSESVTIIAKFKGESEPVPVKVKGLPWSCKVKNGEFHYKSCDKGKKATIEILGHPKNNCDN